jgi:hypothetical protein
MSFTRDTTLRHSYRVNDRLNPSQFWTTQDLIFPPRYEEELSPKELPEAPR